MTTQERISRLASAVDHTRNPGAPPKQNPAASTVALRRNPAHAEVRVLQARISKAFSEAPALPFVPFCYGGEMTVREIFASRKARPNRKRQLNQPPLAMAILCLMSCLSALLATSSAGEARITSWVPAIKKTMDRAEVVVLETFGPDRGMSEISLNGEELR